MQAAITTVHTAPGSNHHRHEKSFRRALRFGLGLCLCLSGLLIFVPLPENFKEIIVTQPVRLFEQPLLPLGFHADLLAFLMLLFLNPLSFDL